jgi:gluconate 5-dehydrogenase
MFNLDGKVAIVTGGTTGLGHQMATSLAEMGADIVVASLDQGLCNEVADEMRRLGRSSIGIEFDLADYSSIQKMINTTIEEYSHIDILVNCAAAIGLTTPYDPITPEIWDKTIEINLTGTFWCSHMAAGNMKQRRRGKIINICSAYAVVGVDPSLYGGAEDRYFEHFPYSSSKGGILGLTRDMAVNYARWNINVNAISPGMFPSPAAIKKWGQEIFDRLRDRTPLRRTGKDDDLKGAVVFLSSPASDFVTGHNLVVDGGWLAW